MASPSPPHIPNSYPISPNPASTYKQQERHITDRCTTFDTNYQIYHHHLCHPKYTLLVPLFFSLLPLPCLLLLTSVPHLVHLFAVSISAPGIPDPVVDLLYLLYKVRHTPPLPLPGSSLINLRWVPAIARRCFRVLRFSSPVSHFPRYSRSPVATISPHDSFFLTLGSV